MAAIFAFAAGAGVGNAATPAGTVISNTAQIGYIYSGASAGARSNRVDIKVGEIIDFSITPAPLCSGSARTADAEIAIGFRIANLGNGREAFVPGAPFIRGGSNFVPRAVVEDSNDNGCYDPEIDRPIPIANPTRPLEPGASVIIFVVGTGGNGIGEIVLPVSPATGTGAPGTAIAGGGDGGGDAVIGASGDTTTASATPPSRTPLQATLIKSQRVRTANDGDVPKRGSIITYTLEAGFTGQGTATRVVIADRIPQGSSYVPGSLQLDGRAISDAADGDAGRFDGAAVAIALGDIAAPAIHSVTFQVKID